MIDDVVIDPDESDIRTLAGSVSRLAEAFTLQIEEDRQARVAQAEKDRLDRVAQEKRLRRGRHQWYGFIGCFMGVLLIAVIWYGRSNNDAASASHRALARVLDCSTPGGSCYQKKAAATLSNNAAIVGALDADNEKAVTQLEQAICNLHPEFCPAGFTAQPPTTTTPGR